MVAPLAYQKLQNYNSKTSNFLDSKFQLIENALAKGKKYLTALLPMT